MKIESLTVGQTVWNVRRYGMGNTTLRSTAVYTVRIVEIDLERGRVKASWNGNTPEWFYGKSISTWKKNEPVMVETAFGARRLATREELKAIKERTE
jgi:hypothetical protein